MFSADSDVIMCCKTFVALVTATVLLSGCAQSPEAARKELGAMAVEYSPSSFIKSVQNSDDVAVKLFLVAGMDPNTEHRNLSALHAATQVATARERGDIHTTSILTALIKAGAEATPRTISVAARAARLDLVEIMLSGAVSTEAKGVALSDVAEGGHSEIVRKLLDSGVDDEAKSRALLGAVRSGSSQLVSYLLEHGANPTLNKDLPYVLEARGRDSETDRGTERLG